MKSLLFADDGLVGWMPLQFAMLPDSRLLADHGGWALEMIGQPAAQFPSTHVDLPRRCKDMLSKRGAAACRLSRRMSLRDCGERAEPGRPRRLRHVGALALPDPPFCRRKQLTAGGVFDPPGDAVVAIRSCGEPQVQSTVKLAERYCERKLMQFSNAVCRLSPERNSRRTPLLVQPRDAQPLARQMARCVMADRGWPVVSGIVEGIYGA
jgi:hypothetical protein